jgi:uncharacterized protein (DUF2235 family)
MDNVLIKRPKKLIVCCDGTWMNSDLGWVDGHPQTPSNVTRLARAINPENRQLHPQIIYYQSGIGSNGTFLNHVFGGGLALGLSENVREAYGFLVNNYQQGDTPETNDSIILVGFSRGAFTARSVAGLIGGIGLLKQSGMQYFYPIFEDWEGAGDSKYTPILPKYCPGFNISVDPVHTNEYIKAYSAELARLGLTRKVDITAVGVWDTVGSLGLPVPPLVQMMGLPTSVHKYRFYDTGIDEHIKNAFQALALDEHRSAFTPTVWEKKEGSKTNLKQCWFSGVHSDVGGSYDDTAASDITLAWMMSQLAPFIEFNEEYLMEQVRLTRQSYKAKNKTWTWGLGALHNSMTFPTNIAGSTTRTPDDYHVTNYASGKPTPALLQNTNEYVHASVRARAILGGKSYDGREYFSDALEHWELSNERADGGKPARWIHREKGNEKTMTEDTLGYFEKKILEQDEQSVAQLFGGYTLE